MDKCVDCGQWIFNGDFTLDEEGEPLCDQCAEEQAMQEWWNQTEQDENQLS